MAIRTVGLTKRYGSRTVVDGLDLSVPRGSMTGFLGPNGAGKTTTLRMLLGLVAPDGGEARVLGAPVRDPAAFLGRVGALVEGPALYPGMSARRNLDVLAVLGGGAPDRVRGGGPGGVLDVLDRVGLTDRAGDPVKSYSLGMRQRLAIAAALLGAPELLVLDEPANGLDPAGVRQVRELLRRVNADGVTVLVSSHVLSEIEHVCDNLVVLSEGRMVYQGRTEALLADRESLEDAFFAITEGERR